LAALTLNVKIEFGNIFGTMLMSLIARFNIYAHFARVAFRRQRSFRLANFSGLFTNLFFLLFRSAVFAALFDHASTVGGYSLAQAVSYAVLVQTLIMVIPQWGQIGVGEDIRSGQIAMDMCRPLNYYLMIMAKRFGISCYFLVARGLPTLAIAYALGLWTTLPQVTSLPWAVISLAAGILLANSLHFLVELSGFWLESPRGPKMLVVGLTYFFSGATIPLAFFPPWAKQLSALLPFAATLNTPIEVLLQPELPWTLLAQQGLWLLVVCSLCFIVLRRGERSLVLHGG
jgi:ABC-2 type transport system permease protein